MAMTSKETLAGETTLNQSQPIEESLNVLSFRNGAPKLFLLSSVIGWEELVGRVASSQRSDRFQSSSWGHWSVLLPVVVHSHGHHIYHDEKSIFLTGEYTACN